MRTRTLLTFSSGAALGASAMYLMDPDHGSDRRREARRHALRRAQQGAAHALVDARFRAEELVMASVRGFEQGRMSSRRTRDDATLRVLTVDDRLAG